MTEDFDIEAYLEAAVDGKEQTAVSSGDKPTEKTGGGSTEAGERRRSRSRERHHGRDRDRDRDRDGDRDNKRKEAVTENVVDDAEVTASKEAAKRQKAIDDLTKDQRTVFISQLTMKVDEKMVRDYFLQLGGVNNVIMIRDKFTGRHKGFAYVEMKDLESIATCLMLNGVVPDFQKFPILVKASEAEKNFLAKKDPAVVAPTHASLNQESIYGPGSGAGGGGGGAAGGGDSRVYIGNLHVNITEEDLSAVLQQVGPLDTGPGAVHIQRDELGASKGYAFARFLRVEDAHKAQTTLSGLELAGRSMRVGFVTDGNNSSNGNNQGDGALQYGSTNWKLDDDEGSGMQMNSQSRSMLMAKLGKAAGIEMPKLLPPPPVPISTPAVAMSTSQGPPPVSGQPSTCFVMKNMFVLEEETEEDWAEYIKEDVTVECQKFGAVLHCHVEQKRPGGFVYMRFPSPEAAFQAANSLNGRWFAGRMITVDFIEPQEYASMFGQP